MNTIVILLGLAAFVAGNPLQSRNGPRRYFPEEEDELRITSFVWQDKDGQYHLENYGGARVVERADINDVTIYLFTKNNPIDPDVIVASNFDTMLAASHYQKQKKNMFIVHGLNNDHTSSVNTLITKALLNNYDMNVFVVDWSRPANKDYFTAKAAVPVIGKVLGDFIYEMITHYDISSKSFNLIGHSLGAHVVGCAGAEIKEKVNYIIGLDPAGPFYSLSNIDNRIDQTDGDFVQIVHTNGGMLAFASSLGHADYYPNGGSKQPGCGIDLFGTCAHSRAYEYLAESIENPGFIAHLCTNFDDFSDGKCEHNERSLMGTINVDKRAFGDYYLSTNKNSPFALY